MNLVHSADIAIAVGISSVFVLIIIVVLGLLYSRPKSAVVRPRKASLPPLHCGYRARQDGQGLRVHPNPPKAPEGPGGGSH